MIRQENAVKSAIKPTPKKVVRLTGVPIVGATGRRKKCVARAWVRKGTGSIIVNGIEYKKYFDTDAMRIQASKPLDVLQVGKSYDFQINIFGGGKVGQSDAVCLAIARALVSMDESVRPVLRQNGLLTVDARIKERKKYGQRGARRKFQFVKR
jgi:small subunit ribosomal protein S9